MRVCFLTHYFPPERGAPQTRIDLLARSLAAAGAEVTVHTGFPHYPDGAIPRPYRNRPWQREHRDGITILRSAVYPAANRGFVPRLADHSALALSALATAGLSGPADVVVGETPPLFTAAAGVLYAAAKRAAYVVNVADRWPQSAVEMGALRNHRAIAAAERLERFTYRHADRITAPTAGIVTALGTVPQAFGKARRLWPVVDLARFDPRPPGAGEGAGGGPEPLRLLYAGTLGMAQGLDVLIDACALAGPDVVQATVAGDGAEAEALRARAEAVPGGNVHMLGAVTSDAVPELYARADAAAVLLRDLPIFEGALPTKMLEAMAAGRALVLSARGEAAALVRQAGAGVVVEPESPPALAAALRALQATPGRRDDLGAAGRDYAEAHFGARRAVEAWTAVLTDAVDAARRAGRAA